MPRQTPSASDFTTVVKSAAVANNIASLPAGSMGAARAMSSAAGSISMGAFSAMGAVIKQSASAKANIPPPSRAIVVVKPDPKLKRTEFASLTMPGAPVDRDVFVAKYYKTGELQWMITVRGDAFVPLRGIATDIDGNVIVTGGFTSNILTIRDSSGNQTTLTRATTTQHTFVIVFDTLGILQWKAKLENVSPGDVVVDSKRNVYVHVYPVSSTSLAHSGAAGGPLALTGGSSIIHYEPNGTVKWAWSVMNTDAGAYIEIDSNDDLIYTNHLIYPASRTANDLGSATGITLTDANLFIMKLRPSTGKAIWMTTINHEGDSHHTHSVVGSDSLGNIFVGFEQRDYTSRIRNVGVSTGSLFTMTSVSNSIFDTFLVKYNTNGLAQWVIRIKQSLATAHGNETLDYRSVDGDSQGNVYVGGRFASGVVGFVNADGNESPITLTNSAAGGFDIFLAKFNSDGILQWAASAGTIFADTSPRVRVDRSSGEVYWAGYVARTSSYLSSFRVATLADPTGVTTNQLGDERTFVMKFSSEGAILWRATNNQGLGGPMISADPYGNVFMGSTSRVTNTTVLTKMA